jgi:hypothetical protein
MAEGRVPEVMPQSDGLDQVFIESKSPSNRTGDLRYFEGVGQTGAVVVTGGREKDLRFVLQTAKGLAVHNSIPVPLESCPKGTFLFVPQASEAHRTQLSLRSQELPLPLFMQNPHDPAGVWLHVRRF